jgi:hypothetical protein
LSVIRLGDSPEAWSRLGFRVDRNASAPASFILGSTLVELSGSGQPFEGWGFGTRASGPATAGTPADPGAGIDGLPLLAAPGEPPPPPPGHPNGITSIDHVVIRSPDLDRTTAALGEAGLEQAGGRTTTSYGDEMEQRFFWAGDVIVELVGPPEAGSGPAAMFGLALVSADLDATAAALGDLMGVPKPAVQEGRSIAGIRGAQVGVSLPLAVMSPHVKASR